MSWPRLLLGIALGLALFWVWGPRDRLRGDAAMDLPADPQAWLAAREAGVRPEVASSLHWAGPPGRRTDLAILYLHGFSASPGELRPLPEDLARALGANLLALRLTGHGLDGRALAAARADDWWRDLIQGLTLARGMGRRVVVLGMSTGATLTALAARGAELGAMMDGVVLISPNFALKARGSWMLDLPGLRAALRLAGDPPRCFAVRNDRHRDRWTSCYPLSAVLPVGALLRQARRGDFRQARMPALFVWSDADRIVDHRISARIAAEWGGSATVLRVTPGAGDDPDAHVLAGDALSPGMTPMLTGTIADWIATLP